MTLVLSTQLALLELKDVPDEMLVLGGGIIGLEMGTVYNRLGSNVQWLSLPTN